MSESAPPEPLSLLRRHGLHPKHSFGQNFLTSPKTAERIAELATSPQGGTVLEIGCGLGALTTPLLARASKVIGVERDRDLVRALQDEFADAIASGRLKLLEADAKTVDVVAVLEQAQRPRVLAGNLPYQITGMLLELAAHAAPALDGAVFMVQLEVADRIVATPGSPNYGALTVFVQAQFSVTRALVVKRGSFFPRPNVDSAVVVFAPRADPVTETPIFRELVKSAFAMRRKKLSNAWAHLLSRADLELAKHAASCGIDLGVRGETLSADEYGALARRLER